MGSEGVNYSTTYTTFNDGKPQGKDLIGTIDVWHDRNTHPGPKPDPEEQALVRIFS